VKINLFEIEFTRI